jgi:myo-inositol 2-dehydrogenase/D-chiro-inositol 1-dehydrogenase
MSEVGLGLIGLGRWGRQHIDGVQKTPGCRLVAGSSRTPETCAAIQQEFGFECYTGLDELLARPDVEAVIISSPNYTHYPFAKQALLAGKHTLLEKPMAFNTGECDDLIATAEKSGKVLWVGHEFRQFAVWREVKRLLATGAIGTPRYGSIQLWRYPYRSGSGGWRADSEQVGNWLLEEPVHYFDLGSWFMQGYGKPQKLYARASSRSAETAQFFENLSALLDFDNGAYLEISRTVCAYNFEIRVRFTGTEGVLKAKWKAEADRSLNPRVRIKLFRFAEQKEEEIPITQQTGHAFELGVQTEMFIKAIRGEKVEMVSGRDGRAAISMCEAAAESIKSGLPVALA